MTEMFYNMSPFLFLGYSGQFRSSVTRLGDFFTLWATFQSPWQQLFCPNCQHILGNFCKFVKIIHFARKILFGQLLWTFVNFLLVTLLIESEQHFRKFSLDYVSAHSWCDQMTRLISPIFGHFPQ